MDPAQQAKSQAESLIAQLIAGELAPGGVTLLVQRAAGLPEPEARPLIDFLKGEADRCWGVNANFSLEIATWIIRIGQARSDQGMTALGMMAHGDALKFIGHLPQAWDELELAGRLYRAANDEVGWARTRIGRLMISNHFENGLQTALADAAEARAIFERCGETERLLRLDLSMGLLHNNLGDHRVALRYFDAALATANLLNGMGQVYTGALHTNSGYAYLYLAEFDKALASFETAQRIFQAQQETSAIATANINVAYVHQAQGNYQQALRLLLQLREDFTSGGLPMEAAHVNRDTVECYLYLNRYDEARELARQNIAEYEALGADYEKAPTLIHLAHAEAEASDFEAAQKALDAAQPIFESRGAHSWLASVHLLRSRIALQQGDFEAARREAAAAADHAGDRQANYARAILLEGQALAAAGDLERAAHSGRSALQIAQRCNLPSLRYGAHVLQARIAEAHGQILRARQHYHAAAATVARVQQRLTLTLRPGFLEDKSEALRSLIRMYMTVGDAANALQTLERAKSQALISHLLNPEALHWRTSDEQSRALLEELNVLRAQHQWFYRMAVESSPDQQAGVLSAGRMPPEVVARERRIRALTEQLYLLADETAIHRRVEVPSLASIQAALPDGAVLVEYYSARDHLWAFLLDRQGVTLHPLPSGLQVVAQALNWLQFNLDTAVHTAPAMLHTDTPGAIRLYKDARRILRSLHKTLIAPLPLPAGARLMIVPYGPLHYLPFNILHDGTRYLIEQHEIVTLPTAALAVRKGPRRPRGARVLAHSWEGRLPQTLREAQSIAEIFGSTNSEADDSEADPIYAEENARASVLDASPRQILHIAAHGEHRIDRPDMSYIALADGHLLADDLLQRDMRYELVTLSACETGRGHVVAGDELIGLSRGVLYGGAGSLLVSLWRINDDSTVYLMEHFYKALRDGVSKAAALRGAQQVALARHPELHPALWGAFNLVGDANPLS